MRPFAGAPTLPTERLPLACDRTAHNVTRLSDVLELPPAYPVIAKLDFERVDLIPLRHAMRFDASIFSCAN